MDQGDQIRTLLIFLVQSLISVSFSTGASWVSFSTGASWVSFSTGAPCCIAACWSAVLTYFPQRSISVSGADLFRCEPADRLIRPAERTPGPVQDADRVDLACTIMCNDIISDQQANRRNPMIYIAQTLLVLVIIGIVADIAAMARQMGPDRVAEWHRAETQI